MARLCILLHSAATALVAVVVVVLVLVVFVVAVLVVETATHCTAVVTGTNPIINTILCFQ
jgi:hypothetical protein